MTFELKVLVLPCIQHTYQRDRSFQAQIVEVTFSLVLIIDT